ncbi:MAG: sensor histidine kinase, partial [Candidatus Aminicenantes bacterium]|nr:sensor histidine kinase [Candidatus Aminicenantes bacterium]
EAGASLIKADFTDTDDKLIKLEIQDNGKGIQDTDLDKVWYPFYTSKPKGTGMGLAIVKKIVNFLNGEINIIKSDNKGTIFQLTFYSSLEEI